jgi:hypothetical protein
VCHGGGSLPRDCPINVVFTTSLNVLELHRFSLPSIERFQHPDHALRAEFPDVA